MRSLSVLLGSVLFLAVLPSGRLATAGTAGTGEPIRSLEALRDRQGVGVRLLAAVSSALPQLLWLRHVTLDARSATLDGSAWSASAVAELVERLGKNRIASFSPPRLASTRAGEDGYDSFSIVLDYQGPGLQAESGGDLLQRVAPRGELAKLQEQIRSAPKDLQLVVQDYRTGAKAVPNGPVDLWPVSIRIEGATFAQVGALLERWSRLSRLVVLEELRMEARDKDRPEMSVSLRLSLPTAGRPDGISNAGSCPVRNQRRFLREGRDGI
ncbi:MAG TPA: PilN domain-containing protein [Thermoanaerobaculia bacterium]|jgi:hypothetical protein|nr:PilN domain-containing protein [Thermoanaerobaculia bacterium]